MSDQPVTEAAKYTTNYMHQQTNIPALIGIRNFALDRRATGIGTVTIHRPL